MRTPSFSAESIRVWLHAHKVATLPELKQALGTEVGMTVFRKLRELGYHSSYSHRGQYYTLDEIARFDEQGLWSHHGIWFSRLGSLLNSAESFVQISEAGYFSHELENRLHVSVKEALLQLVSERRLARESLAHRFLYCASEPALHKQQLLARRMMQAQPPWPGGAPLPEAVSAEAKAAIVLFFSLLDEQQRRLYAGLQSLLLGHGGDQQIAELLGLDPHTVARRPASAGRARCSGGAHTPLGRRSQTGGKKTPEVIQTIEWLLAQDTAGDPITGLKWTHKTTEKIAQQLQCVGIQVGRSTVARLLDDLDYALRVNQKKRAGASSPDRNEQFLFIQDMRQRFQRQGNPIISVDAKKHELIGNFKNAGAKWSASPEPVNDHDFPSLASGKGIPYGIYDPQANRGVVFVGVSHDTSTFAVSSIRSWWCWEGRHHYAHAKKLLILADAGGSNSVTNGVWKEQLQSRLCDRLGLSVTVCHYPTSTSKWNPIEHRLFSQISKNWAGEPLRTYETMLNFIRTTTTKTGLRVKAYLDRRDYPKGLKVSEDCLAALRITHLDPLPRWNYTLAPRM